jgi:hypothetical protein
VPPPAPRGRPASCRRRRASAAGKVDQAPLLPARGHQQPDAAAAARAEERLQVRRLGRESRGEDRRRHVRRAGVVLEHEAAERLVVADLGGCLQDVDVAPDQLPGPHGEDLDRRLVARAGEAQHVELRPGEGGHLLVLHRALDRSHLVPHRRGALVLGPPRGGLHLAAELANQGLLAPLEEELDLGDVGPVGLLPDGLDARPLAALDVVEEARPAEGPLPLPDLQGAGPEREQAPDQVHRLVDAARRRVGPEVAAPVAHELAGPLDSREVLAQRDPDIGVALVVLEADVEAGLVTLDEVRLEEERLRDGIGQGVFEVRHTVDHLADPVDLAGPGPGRLALPIGADAGPEVLRLAHVEHGASRVAHEVDARVDGQAGEGRFELGGHRSMLHGRPPEAAKPRRRAGQRP